jgi:HK97 gp10 family phage protein
MGKNKVKMTPQSKRKFNQKMKALAKFVKPNKGFSKLLAGMGTDIIRRSSRKVPVDSGTLKQSVYLEGKPFSVEVGYNADYATPVEFGTYKMKPQPFFRPAIAEAKKNFNKNWSVQIRKEYRK